MPELILIRANGCGLCQMKAALLWRQGYTIDRNTNAQCWPLDVVSVDIIKSVPIRNQQENCLINEWNMSKLCTCNLPQVLRLHPAENHQYIFGNNSECLTAQEMQRNNFQHSLMIVRADDFILYRCKVLNQQNQYQEKSKANFVYNGQYYEHISVTDPEYFSAPNGINLGSVYIVVSMPCTSIYVSSFQSKCYYKFIAKIFPACL